MHFCCKETYFFRRLRITYRTVHSKLEQQEWTQPFSIGSTNFRVKKKNNHKKLIRLKQRYKDVHWTEKTESIKLKWILNKKKKKGSLSRLLYSTSVCSFNACYHVETRLNAYRRRTRTQIHSQKSPSFRWLKSYRIIVDEMSICGLARCISLSLG